MPFSPLAGEKFENMNSLLDVRRESDKIVSILESEFQRWIILLIALELPLFLSAGKK